ncbi:MAG TPA: hypothetical protein VNF91_03160 [Candidatus Acidoferrum sp.]|nr:hypothetical protein [Candidatus Acidoferrum sp.]
MRGQTDQRSPAPDFGRVTPEHAAIFIGIMSMLHGEPVAPAFGRLLKKCLQADDYVLLAHLFEEISVLALHHLVPEALLFDAFGFDLYWDELREDIMSLRQQTGNEKFCENFEIAADRARAYRNDRPPKRRWQHGPEGDRPDDRPGGSHPRPEVGPDAPGAPTETRREAAIRRRG